MMIELPSISMIEFEAYKSCTCNISHLCLIGFLGLLRCGKSCRMRWINYLRPDIRKDGFTPEEDKLIISLHGIVGNRFELHYIPVVL